MSNNGTVSKYGDAISEARNPITSEAGDEIFDALIGERRFGNAAVKDRQAGLRPQRPEPYHPPAGSSLTTGDGGHTGRRAG